MAASLLEHCQASPEQGRGCVPSCSVRPVAQQCTVAQFWTMTIHLPDNCLAWSKGKPGPGAILWKQLQCIILLLWCKMFCKREYKTQGLDWRPKSDPWWRWIWLGSVEKEAACTSPKCWVTMLECLRLSHRWAHLRDPGSSALQGNVECSFQIITWVIWDYVLCSYDVPDPVLGWYLARMQWIVSPATM